MTAQGLQKIVPNLWFSTNAEAAVNFYTEVFPNSAIGSVMRYPTDGLPEFQQAMAGKVLTMEFELNGYRLLAVNGGDEFAPNTAISFMLNFDPSHMENAREQLDVLWEKLADEGEILMPLGEYPFSPRYGWVQDKFGFSWQLILTNPEGEPRPFIVPSLMFAGANQNKAEEAVKLYVSTFGDSRRGTTAPYPAQTGPAKKGSVMFADFRLESQWFAAMDSGVEQQVAFDESVSLIVNCADQAEIDRLWNALSADESYGQCGWLKDKYGVRWQIVPSTMGELLSKNPAAMPAMMQMKKIIIKELEEAA